MFDRQEYPSEAEIDEEGNVLSAEDWLGNRFAIGDLVMYCISAGRGQMMAIGRVKALRIRESSKTHTVPDTSQPKNNWGSYPYKHVPSPQHKWVVEVQVLTDRTSGHWNNERRTRPAWVNEMNITAIKGFEQALL